MANTIKKGLAAAAVALIPLFTQAQTEGPLPCGTTEAVQQLMRRNPAYARQMADQVNRLRAAQANANRGAQLTPLVIPMVVHIIHENGGSNISREQVMDAVRMVNEDFSRQNADTVNVIQPFKNLVANAQIEFRLAKLDPNGNCTDGITRTYSPLTNSADDNVKDLIRWDPSKYLNIWVVRTISFGAGGYSYYPCPGPDIDGIVVRNAQFGSIGTSSPSSLPRSLTHEIGHYLDLPHTWGSTNEPGLPSNCSTDDGIADTPNTAGVSNGGCNTSAQSCNTLNNVQNIMDYASCQLMFTHGQADAMNLALNTASCRTNLWSQANLIATGTNDGFTAPPCAPTVDFASLKRRVCEGATVQFTDMSFNAVVDSTWSWSWSFPGGSPAISTDKNPLVVYTTPGLYPVSLTVTNAGGSNSLSRPDYLEVVPVNTGLSAPYAESFESNTFPAVPALPVQNWTIENAGSTTWERTTLASATGSSAMRIRHAQIGSDFENSLISPNINTTGLTPKVLSFKIAYAPFTNQGSDVDRLKVYYSIDCGQSWVLRYAKSGAALQTTPAVPVAFVPNSPTQWRQETVTIPNSANTFMLKFESTSGNGNTLYLDDINLNTGLVGLEEGTSAQGLWVFPNPSQGQAQIRYQLAENEKASLSVRNAIGQQVGISLDLDKAGVQEVALEKIAGKLPSGIYFIRLQSAAQVTIQKLVIN